MESKIVQRIKFEELTGEVWYAELTEDDLKVDESKLMDFDWSKVPM